ncbi:YgfZ/GcvT domain-containing protein [Paremcibacter congregatus]|uniref:CAF17-like 4Fe-4S cluster assembly/insertion protein YgfZ n=1 Tax=Paremcibacter congregatus TaxID=2043170 RepID=UPI003A94A616
MTASHPVPVPLNNRAILTLGGPDRKKLLQGIITNNVDKIAPGQMIYAALLTPQGKYLFDFFLSEFDEVLFLDCEADRATDLLRRLMMYKLRADVEIKDVSALYRVVAGQGIGDAFDKACPDPRHAGLGFRAIVPQEEAAELPDDISAYETTRLRLGIPDGARDFDVDKTLILEGNMEELHGVDFNKGCYVGQEVTARMKHRTSLKKRLLPVTVNGPLPARGSEICNSAGKKVGDIRSGFADRAIGYFRLADLTFGDIYTCGDATVTPEQPDWIKDI